MTAKNKYLRLKTKVQCVMADIKFLKRCKRNKIIPKFTKLHGPRHSGNNKIVNKAVFAGQMIWLNSVIRTNYSRLSTFEREAYSLDLYLSKKLDNGIGNDQEAEEYQTFMTHVEQVVNHNYHVKKTHLINKFNHWRSINSNQGGKKYFKNVEHIDNFVRNLSNKEFTSEELLVLNKGLDFAIQPSQNEAIESVAVNIESAIKWLDDEDEKIRIRCEAAEIINNIDSTRITSETMKFKRTINCFKNKKDQVAFAKADKSNNSVIMDKQEYIKATERFIHIGPYKEVNRDPLPGMIRRTKEAIQVAANVFKEEENLKRRLNVSNPTIPRMYTLLK